MAFFNNYYTKHTFTTTSPETLTIQITDLTNGDATLVPVIQDIYVSCTTYVSTGVSPLFGLVKGGNAVNLSFGSHLTLNQSVCITEILPISLSGFALTDGLFFSMSAGVGEVAVVSVNYQLIPATHPVLEAVNFLGTSQALNQNTETLIFQNGLSIPILIKTIWIANANTDVVYLTCGNNNGTTPNPRVLSTGTTTLPYQSISEVNLIVPPNYAIRALQTSSASPLNVDISLQYEFVS
jgi:hypothetical protein